MRGKPLLTLIVAGLTMLSLGVGTSAGAENVTGGIAVTVANVVPPGKLNKEKSDWVAWVQVAFNTPPGSDPDRSCAGRMSVGIQVGSKSVRGKRRTLYSSRPARFASGNWAGGVCAVWAFVPVAKRHTGIRRQIVVDFKGNTIVRPFRTIKRRAISRSDDPVKGPWRFGNWPGLTGSAGWGFVLPPNNSIANVTTYGVIPMACPAPFGTVGFNGDSLVYATSHMVSRSGGNLTGVHKDSIGQDILMDASYQFKPSSGQAASNFRIQGAIVAINPLTGLPELVGGCSSGTISLDTILGFPFDNGDKVRGPDR